MKLLVTRQLTPEVEARAAREFDVTFRNGGAPMDEAEAAQALADYDALLVTLGDQVTAGALKTAPRAKMIANFGVGYNHIDAAAAAQIIRFMPALTPALKVLVNRSALLTGIIGKRITLGSRQIKRMHFRRILGIFNPVRVV